MSNIKKAAPSISNFQRDLDDRGAGLDSDLFGVVNPLISSEHDADLKGHDLARTQKLKEQVRQGLVGLEYMTGIKTNKGKTFYDEHPIQAAATDVLKNSGKIGAGVAAGGIGYNMIQQIRNMRMTEKGSMSRKGDPTSGNNPTNLLDGRGKPVREDISRLFGDYDVNPSKRLQVLDQLNHTAKSDPASLESRHSAIKSTNAQAEADFEAALKKLEDQKPGASRQELPGIDSQIKDLEKRHGKTMGKSDTAKKDLFSESANLNPASAALEDATNIHESLHGLKRKGKKLHGYLGENLHDIKSDNKVLGWIKKHLAPGKDQAVGDLMEKGHFTGASPHYSKDIAKQIYREYVGGGDFSKAKDPRGHAFETTTLDRIGNPAIQRSGLTKLWDRSKLPIAAGAGIAVGGKGLYHLVKALQNQVYSDDQTKDWKKTLLKSRGEFDRADRIK